VANRYWLYVDTSWLSPVSIAVATNVIEVYDEAGVDATGADLWALMEWAEPHGIEQRVKSTISHHEHARARDSRRLSLAEDVADQSVPVGVCSLNCERGRRIALDTHDLSERVGTKRLPSERVATSDTSSRQ